MKFSTRKGSSEQDPLHHRIDAGGIAAVITLSLFTMKRELFEDRKVKTKHVVESVYGILEHYEGLAKQGR